MDQVRFGVIGVGNMGSAHTAFLAELPECALTAVCDIDPAAFGRVDPRWQGKIMQFTDAEAFFRSAPVDVVMVATPHYFHPDLAIRAMECDRHVIVEKPIAAHKAEAERLLAAAARHPRLIKSAMFNQRTIPAHRKIKELIDTGELGAIRRINWIITDWFRSQCYYDSGDWRASWRGEGGGVLLNQCPHQLDLMQWFFGMPVRVRAEAKFGKYHDIEVEDEVNAYWEYADGKTANFIASTGEIPGTNRLEISAERGRLVFENGRIEFKRNEIETSQFSRTTRLRFGIPTVWDCVIPADGGNPHQHRDIIANVAAAVARGEPLIAPLEEGIRGLELGNAMLLSAWRGETVSLPLDSADYAARLERLVETSRYRKKVPAEKTETGDFSRSF